MTLASAGIDAAEGGRLLLVSLRPLAPEQGIIRPVLLAVSGGPDSLALLVLAAENIDRLRLAGFRPVVATVDHRLRPESAAEADFVAAEAERLALPHYVLPWLGAKPTGNLAAAARDARYALLATYARQLGAPAILTAHHQDDQIETHLLAGARGAGDRGLAGMRDARRLSPDLWLLRPFLSVPGARLKASVAERGLVCVDDPSNRDPRFDRARLRATLRLDATERQRCLARIAAHGERRTQEDAALGAWCARLLESGALSFDECGCARLEAAALRADDPRLAELLLGFLLRAVAGADYPPSAAAVVRLGQRLRAGGKIHATLGGAAVHGNAIFTFMREYGRRGLEILDIADGCDAIFDRRFRIFNRNFDELPVGSRIVAFGALGRGNAVTRTLPVAIDSGGHVVAVHPALARPYPRARLLDAAEMVSARLFSDLASMPKI
ncbi:tRNA lysidine(34) synthetase TilS [Aureimonas psammosilenae]|uniref:tRNA lysidine(34) synthetase TilS n=1 Tax=Aureimonas psammosilenae TaxID=2495496 RepID=UPI00186A5043|nr:tRNA lysidine(34) synthetase TilS [Aureimonas psammosilenae]